MTAAIVSDPMIMGGRWVFRNSRIPVATIVHALRSWDRDRVRREWPALTDAMIDAAEAWTFPPLADAPTVEYVDLDLRCVCGERINADGAQSAAGFRVACRACDKKFRITIRIEPV